MHYEFKYDYFHFAVFAAPSVQSYAIKGKINDIWHNMMTVRKPWILCTWFIWFKFFVACDIPISFISTICSHCARSEHSFCPLCSYFAPIRFYASCTFSVSVSYHIFYIQYACICDKHTKKKYEEQKKNKLPNQFEFLVDLNKFLWLYGNRFRFIHLKIKIKHN